MLKNHITAHFFELSIIFQLFCGQIIIMRILATLLLVVFFVSSCKKPQDFEYRDLRNFKIDSLGFEKSSISMDLVYFNPNNYGVVLKNIDCDVYVEHNYLGKYLLDTTMHIPKKSEFAIPSHMQVDMKNLFKNTITSLFSNDLLLEVKGTTRLGKGGIYVTVPFTYSGRHKFSMFE